MKKIQRACVVMLLVLLACTTTAQTDSLQNRKSSIKDTLLLEQLNKKILFDNDKTPSDLLPEFQLKDLQLKEQNISAVVSDEPAYKAYKVMLQNTSKVSYSAFSIIKNKELEIATPFPGKSVATAATPALIGSDMEISPVAIIQRLAGPSQFDSRVEPRSLNPLIADQKKMLDNARSVGLVIRKDDLTAISDSLYQINTGLTLGKKFNLCAGEAFAEQPVAGVGTAFLIDSATLMTAAHVLSGPVNLYAVVFGFEIANKTGSYETLIPASNIYYPVQVSLQDDDQDLAIARLDRKADRPALLTDQQPPIAGAEIYMIGYPSGLPQKVALNADITNAVHPQYFFTTLDAFQGNSGSPVFNKHTHQVIGMLVSGETDYTWNGSCNTSSLCEIPFCQGEKVIKIKTLYDSYSISDVSK